MRWLKDIETSPTAALPSSVIIENTPQPHHHHIAAPSTATTTSVAASITPSEHIGEEAIEDTYAVPVTVPATPSSPILMPPPKALPARGRPQLSITIGTPAAKDETHTPASGLPPGAAAAGIVDGYDLGTTRRRGMSISTLEIPSSVVVMTYHRII
jgi:hypothetical protein